eukprot:gene8473-14464_t
MGAAISYLPSINKPKATVIIAIFSGILYAFPAKIGDEFMKLLHLGSFATFFGTQFWVTLVSGVVMYNVLPRQMFGLLQSKMFPKYFLAGTFFSSVALSSYVANIPVRIWSGDQKIQGWLLGLMLASNAANYYVIEPITTAQMFKCHKYEREHGESGQEVGIPLSKGLQSDKTYMELRGMFFKLHAVSSLVNMVSLGCSSAYLWYLAKSLNW